MQEEVLASASVDVFEEVFKLFFVKVWDEENASDDPNDDSSICRFRVTADEPEKQFDRLEALLDEACDTNVYHMSSLDPREWRRDSNYQKNVANKSFDIIMTNPPFAGTIRHRFPDWEAEMALWPEMIATLVDFGLSRSTAQRLVANPMSRKIW